MKKVTIICDKCKREKDVQTLTFFVGRNATPAGDMEDEFINIDLCSKCLAIALKFVLTDNFSTEKIKGMLDRFLERTSK